MLVKDAEALRDRADVLIREAEVAAAESREAMQQSAAEGLRRLIQTKLRDGTLPCHEISGIVPGYPGDGSTCEACTQPVKPDQLMMVVPHTAKPLYLHADCFEIWNDERRA